MRNGVNFFLAILLFGVLAALGMLAQEQRDVRTITIKGSEVNNGVVVLAAREGKNSFELQCNKNVSGCAVLEPGNYLMVQLPKNHGVYDCTNVDLYRTTTGSEVGDKLGQYCLMEGK
jgi:hypothetical protein